MKPTVSAPDLSVLSTLIVEDNEHMRVLLRSLLQSLGIKKITECIDGTEAFAELETLNPDFILTDLSMVPMDGIEFTKRVRRAAHERQRLTPIIMISGHTERSRVEAARDAGVTEILAKPITVSGLIHRINEVILKPRQFVNTEAYFGPCRRRHALEDYTGPWRRKTDTEESPETRSAAGKAGRHTHSLSKAH